MKTKADIFKKAEELLQNHQIKITGKDEKRPWGGFLVVDESDAEQFINVFFSGFKKAELEIAGKLSPKILLVAPEKRLSWQYHHRRAEIWKLIDGSAKVITSDDDNEKKTHLLKPGDIITLKQEERHRLIGTHEWGIVAEIWQHTDAQNPSNEEDIVRLQDDFGRKS